MSTSDKPLVDPRPNESLRCQVSGLTDQGKKRAANQDHFLIADLSRLLTVQQSSLPGPDCEQLFGAPTGRLLLVADGMGGHESGEQASSQAVQGAARYVLDMMTWFLRLTSSCEDDFQDELKDCLKAIERKIENASAGQARPMGTTVTMGYVLWPRLYIVHAGDSRCYLVRDGELQQLTTDHTFAQQLIDSGEVDPNDERLRRWRHVLWNCVGGTDTVSPEVSRVMMRPDDTLLLCSDGLTGVVSDGEIADVLAKHDSLEDANKELIKRANQAGGPDNITVVLANYSLAQGSGSLEDTVIR
jgi:serine/threonine protein phosphatase PrpC